MIENKSKKHRRYVQTETQMQAILMQGGLADARLQLGPRDPETAWLGTERVKTLLEIAQGLDQGLRAFGRRNLPLRDFLAQAHKEVDPKVDPRAGLLPLFRIDEGGQVKYLYTAEELEAEHNKRQSPAAASAPDAAAPGAGEAEVAASTPDGAK